MTKDKVSALLVGQRVVTEASSEAKELFEQSRFGNLLESGKVQLALVEALYLAEKGRISVQDTRGKEIKFDKLFSTAERSEKNFFVRYSVYKDIRNRGYIIKTALKFGADFRVYDRGVKPGEDHAKWIVYPVREEQGFSWHEFSAKNRVAHSTKKRLLIGIVDAEGDVTYYEIRWVRP